MAAGIPFVSTNCGDVTDRAEFGKVYNDPHNLADGIEFFLHYHEYRNERNVQNYRLMRLHYTLLGLTVIRVLVQSCQRAT